jgi:hypothetical protein
VAFEKRYKKKPAAREGIKSTISYAVFSSIDVNVFPLSIHRGGGILPPGEALTLLWVQSNPAPGRSIVNATIHID